MKDIHITLVGLRADLPREWKKEFKNLPVEIKTGDLFDLSADAVVSPANSFGYMDGGLDGKLRDFFGIEIERKVQHTIKTQYNGELLVGQAIVTTTDHPQYKSLITAPTMRVPADVSDSINAYLAMKAIIQTAIAHPNINSFVCSGLCSLSGQMRPEVVARQMAAAYRKVILNDFVYRHWRYEKYLEDYLKCLTPFEPDPL